MGVGDITTQCRSPVPCRACFCCPFGPVSSTHMSALSVYVYIGAVYEVSYLEHYHSFVREKELKKKVLHRRHGLCGLQDDKNMCLFPGNGCSDRHCSLSSLGISSTVSSATHGEWHIISVDFPCLLARSYI
jgi:hypothetical protein